MLGYRSQKDLLQVDIKTLYVHPEDRAAGMIQIERDGELRNWSWSCGRRTEE